MSRRVFGTVDDALAELMGRAEESGGSEVPVSRARGKEIRLGSLDGWEVSAVVADVVRAETDGERTVQFIARSDTKMLLLPVTRGMLRPLLEELTRGRLCGLFEEWGCTNRVPTSDNLCEAHRNSQESERRRQAELDEAKSHEMAVRRW